MKHALRALIAGMIILLVGPGSDIVAFPLTTIDFDDLSDGTLVSDQYAALGITFAGYDIFGSRDIRSGYFGGPSGTIVLDSYCNGGGYIQATFTGPVDFVSVDFQLFEGDDPLTLELYNAAGEIVVSRTVFGLDDQWYTLTARSAAQDVAFARFYGFGDDGVNAVYNDNISFGNSAVIPEPATFGLVGLGLLSLAVVRRQHRR
ncbi:MAG: PEP-CTERM sorting domain-containing protein [candidate division Zixibacteria bacterium]|jgi:hypothetical protein|nr:PEP-CTERM sorting domain-containing protein [candidate division Zixibacteria bacterium]